MSSSLRGTVGRSQLGQRLLCQRDRALVGGDHVLAVAQCGAAVRQRRLAGIKPPRVVNGIPQEIADDLDAVLAWLRGAPLT